MAACMAAKGEPGTFVSETRSERMNFRGYRPSFY